MTGTGVPREIEDWFAGRGWRIRDHQRAMLEASDRGDHALLVADTGAGWTLDTFSLADLGALIARLKDNPQEIAAARARTEDFWRAHIDARKQIAPLADMLRSNAKNVA